MKKLLLICATAALFGAGCTPSASPETAGQPPVPSSSASATAPNASATGTEHANSNSAVSSSGTSPSPVDNTWKSYTSKANDFSFQWPTKGSYAPTWDVSFSDTGCGDDAVTLDVDGVSFCHTSMNEGAAGSAYYTDEYRTKLGSKYVVITFLKRVTNAGALDCKFPDGINYSTSPTSCIPFDPAVYQSTLNQIIGTFSLTAK